MNSLASLATTAESIDLTAPASTGTYYYGACVESVSGESRTHNNCSGARVTVKTPLPECRMGMTLALFESCRTPSGRIITCEYVDGCIVF